MTQLPQKLPYDLHQVQWAKVLNPVIASPISTPVLLQGIKLVTGANTVNHTLGKPLTGWVISRFNGSWAQVYDTQDANAMPDLTLNLNASANVTVDILVF